MNPLYQDELLSPTVARQPSTSAFLTPPPVAPGIGISTPPTTKTPAKKLDHKQELISQMSGPQKFFSALGDFGAAIQGRPLPIDARIKARQEERVLKFEQEQTESKLLKDNLEISAVLEGDVRTQFVEQKAAKLEELSPGLGGIFRIASNTPDRGAVMMKHYADSDTARRLYETGGMKAVNDFLAKPEGMKLINSEIDAKVMNRTLYKKGESFQANWQQIAPPEMVQQIMQDNKVSSPEILAVNAWGRKNRPDLNGLWYSDEDLTIIGRNSETYWNALGIDSPKQEQEMRTEREKEASKGNKIEWIGQPGGKKQQAAIDKQGNIVKLIGSPIEAHAPAVNIYNSGLTAGVNEAGQPVFAQASGRPDVPPRVAENVFPPEKADQRKAQAKAAENEATFASIDRQITELQALVTQTEGKFSGATGIKGFITRAAEAAAGVVNPDVEHPALNARNKKELLVASLRKAMADPNMSKADKDALEAAMGGLESIWATKGSTIDGLENLRSFVRDKYKQPEGRTPLPSKPNSRGGFDFPKGEDQNITPMGPPIKGPGSDASGAEFVKGKIYKDANGHRGKYLGDGKWQPVK